MLQAKKDRICPYEECSYTSSAKNEFYEHIRVHDCTFPKLNSFKKYIFTAPDGTTFEDFGSGKLQVKIIYKRLLNVMK